MWQGILGAAAPFATWLLSVWTHIVTSIITYKMAGLVSFLDFVVASRVAQFYRLNVKHRVHWIRSFLVVFVTYFGGSSLTAVLLGRTPSWAEDPTSPPAVVLAWYLMFHCPGDVWWGVYNAPVVQRACTLVEAINLSHALGDSGVARALKFAKDNIMLQFICGMTTATGGGLINEATNLMPRDPTGWRDIQLPTDWNFLRVGLGVTILMVLIYIHPLAALAGVEAQGTPWSMQEGVAVVALLFIMEKLSGVDHLIPRALTHLLEALVPGFRQTFVPCNLAMEADWTAQAQRAQARQQAVDPSPARHADATVAMVQEFGGMYAEEQEEAQAVRRRRRARSRSRPAVNKHA